MIYLRLFWEFFRIGMVTFGGGLAMIPLIQDAVCRRNGWMTDDEMTDCIAVTQSMPGIIAVNIATYVGGRQKGLAGAACATVGVVIPGFLILVLMLLLDNIGDNRFVQGAMVGIKAASVGLILISAAKMGAKILKNLFTWIVAAGVFIMVAGMDISAIVLVLAAAAAGIIYVSIDNSRREERR